MCGVVGYVGAGQAAPVLIDGLQRLEYRGYDSAGIAVVDNGRISSSKEVGRLVNLEQVLERNPVRGCCGIGHTRWATHGAPSQANSHPHFSSDGAVSVVHNGIIENYAELRDELLAQGHTFLSQTDTEVIPHLIEQFLRDGAESPEVAFRCALQKLRGAYALGVLFQTEPDTVYCARSGSPLIIGLGKDENFIASDVPAIINRISEAIYLNDGEMAALRADRVEVSTIDGQPVSPDIKPITFEAEAAEHSGFETFMLKEIHEQPRILRALLEKHVSSEGQVLLPDGLSSDYFRKLNRIMIVSCGTAYHAGMYGKLLMENLTGIAVETDLASEFRYRDPKIDPGTLVIAVSQSGETADTLASIRMAKDWGCRIFSICNVEGSSVVRESDAVFLTECGPEIGVASTKAYTAQQMAFALLTLSIASARGNLSPAELKVYLDDLRDVPDAVHYVIRQKELIQKIGEKHHDGPSSLYLGRRFNYPTALEGALKNKEISYQHAEGYAAGEMKHGPIALINESLPVVCICTQTADEVYEKMLSNIKEVEARNGRIIAVASEGDSELAKLSDDVIYVPAVRDEFSPMVNVAALQLLAYYAARARGTDIDKPRNLAKSVTVE
ncbi:glutamine--fructose-6-phosphate transaminase (isomerizing) [Tichowtungia aerotolerans]|uniref:Glutamine--fructose-6-phosphate aminotransferase [isomerizing] n=1 Tax=Tichowtungia aerotolerans TaxID=2697043 RepID=A0A6P1M7P0_9BACT|nr:glutamine--fructose-6-phosphate transaminase (isomerizing) [Tichowtungia aerotolerans]QHI69881.1 glutamine--fructose-6-phosphate transaminase (isomerizing) [Tichowtungia aerotolerans]